MRKRLLAAWTCCGLALLAGCAVSDGNGESARDEGSASSAEEYYDAMQMGAFADMSEENLDTVGKALCADLRNLEPDERGVAVIALRESVDTDAEAVFAARAITARWCPEISPAFE